MNRRKFCQSTLAAATAAALFPAQQVLAAMLKVGGDVDAINAEGKQTILQQAAVHCRVVRGTIR